MIIGTIKEKKKFENRVSITPDEVKNYVKSGHQVFVEKNAGILSGFTDKSYKEAGASMASQKDILKAADVLLKLIAHLLMRLNNLNRNVWLYLSLKYKQRS